MIRKPSMVNVIFGVGIGLISNGNSYPSRESRDYAENNYNDYYDGRNYMMNYPMNGMNVNGMNGMNVNVPHNINPLYQYLQTHPQHQQTYMYSPHRQY